jgi:RNA polymerase sigma-70 factor (ECF subfamily)
MERDLVERAMEGDREAFSALGHLWIDRLYAIARLILQDGDLAEDATQEALVDAWRGLSGLRDPQKFQPWLRRLLVNACYREANRSGSRARAEGRVRPLDEHDRDPADAIADRDELDGAFSTLNPRQRALIVMHYYLGLPVLETASVLGLPVGTVKSQLSRTTRQMRATLDANARLPVVEGQAT